MREPEAGSDDADKTAMERLAQGDDVALNEIMDRWTPRLGAYLTRFLGSEADASDLVQETFIAVYRSRSRYRPRAKFSTWLFGIASNLARQRLRWRSRHPEVAYDLLAEEAMETAAGVESQQTPLEKIQEQERAVSVRAAVLSLPTDLREALLLSEVEDLPHAESATVLKCSVKAVETRVYRAKQLLRRKLAAK